jgi:hypothetical protein
VTYLLFHSSWIYRAYIVHKTGAANAPKSFPKDVQLWIEARVAKHKFLRGGVVIIDSIPKRFVTSNDVHYMR